MTNAKHTPGKWIAGTSHALNRDGGWQSFKITDEHGKSICACSSNVTRTGEEIIANARLIAAAPELLAALENLLKAADLFFADNEGLCGREQARAAIAKARGTD